MANLPPDWEDQLDEESKMMLDVVLNGQDATTARLIRALDNRFRSHRRRLLALEQRLDCLEEVAGDVKLVKRAVVAAPLVLAAVTAGARFMGAI